ncbi:hypothetical protein LLG88_11150 [bacterium]|nr:hypothetical protein [bacterium]
MRHWFKFLVAAFLVTTVGIGASNAQFGKLAGKKDTQQAGSEDGAKNALEVLAYVTLATDTGMRAAENIANAFPPEKVAAFREISKKYAEATKNRKDGNLDADQVKLASQAADELAKLAADWKSYRKDGVAEARKANLRLGVMLVADGVAATKIPGAVEALKSQAGALSSNPLKAGEVKRLTVSAAALAEAGKQIPDQLQKFQTVRTIAKQICEAEKAELSADPAPDALKDLKSLQKAVPAD